MSTTGEPYVIPRDAKGILKTHCDHIYGRKMWCKVLIEMGGCHTEFVDATNFVTDRRLKATF